MTVTVAGSYTATSGANGVTTSISVSPVVKANQLVLIIASYSHVTSAAYADPTFSNSLGNAYTADTSRVNTGPTISSTTKAWWKIANSDGTDTITLNFASTGFFNLTAIVLDGVSQTVAPVFGNAMTAGNAPSFTAAAVAETPTDTAAAVLGVYAAFAISSVNVGVNPSNMTLIKTTSGSADQSITASYINNTVTNGTAFTPGSITWNVPSGANANSSIYSILVHGVIDGAPTTSAATTTASATGTYVAVGTPTVSTGQSTSNAYNQGVTTGTSTAAATGTLVILGTANATAQSVATNNGSATASVGTARVNLVVRTWASAKIPSQWTSVGLPETYYGGNL